MTGQWLDVSFMKTTLEMNVGNDLGHRKCDTTLSYRREIGLIYPEMVFGVTIRHVHLPILDFQHVFCQSRFSNVHSY